MDKKRVLDVLNSLEVIDEYGGDDFAVIVESSEENFRKLEEVGVSREIALKFGDEESFCIAALAFSEGYADWYEDGKFMNKTYDFECILENIISNAAEGDEKALAKNKEELVNMYRVALFRE